MANKGKDAPLKLIETVIDPIIYVDRLHTRFSTLVNDAIVDKKGIDFKRIEVLREADDIVIQVLQEYIDELNEKAGIVKHLSQKIFEQGG